MPFTGPYHANSLYLNSNRLHLVLTSSVLTFVLSEKFADLENIQSDAVIRFESMREVGWVRSHQGPWLAADGIWILEEKAEKVSGITGEWIIEAGDGLGIINEKELAIY